MKIFTDFIVSRPGSHNWSEVFGYRPETEGLANIFGEMFAVMSISSEMDFDLSKIGGFLFDELQQSYFRDSISKVTFNDFEEAVYKVKQRVETILARETELAKVGIDLEMGVVVIKGNSIYGAVVGETRLFIERQGNFAEIAKSFIDSEADGFMRSGSLVLEPEDRIMLATHKLAAAIEDEAPDILADFNLTEYTAEDGAGLIIGYNLQEDPKLIRKNLVVIEDDVSAEQNEEDVDLIPQGEDEVEIKNQVEIKSQDDAGSDDDDDDQNDELPQVSQPMSPRDRMLAANRGTLPGGRTPRAYDYDDEEDDEEYEDVEEDQAGGMKQKISENISAAKENIANLGGQIAGKLQSVIIGLTSKLGGNTRIGDRAVVSSEDVEQAEVNMAARQVRQQQTAALAGKLGDTKDMLNAKLVPALKQGRDKLLSLVRTQPGNREVYLRGRRPQYKWKTIILIAIVLGGAIVLIISRTNAQREVARQIKAVEDAIVALDTQWQSLKSRSITVDTAENSVAEKEALISDIQKAESTAKELLTKNINKNKLENILDEVKSTRETLLNMRNFTEPQLVADLGVTFEGAQPVAISYSGGNLYVLDKAKSNVYRMATNLKSEAAVFASGLNSPYLMTTNAAGDLVVADQNSDSVIATIAVSNGQVRRAAGLSIAKVGTLSAIDIYEANSALYSANPTKGAIFKQDNSGSGYALPNDANPWRRDGDAANIVDLAVDYSLFTAITGKGMVRFIGGQPATYNPAGFITADQTALTKIVAFAITPTKLYMADPANRRVIIANRTDENTYTFAEQFVYSGTDAKVFTEIKDIVVNESTRNIFVLDGTRIVRLDM